MTDRDPLDDLELLIRSRYGLVVVETEEEERAGVLFRHLADRFDVPLFSWSATKGLRRGGREEPVYGTTDPGAALEHVEHARFPAVYHFRGLGPHLSGERLLARKLRDAAKPYEELSGAVILTGTDVELPAAVRPMSATFRLPEPGLEEYRELVREIVRDLDARSAVRVDVTEDELTRLLRNVQGLTLLEAEKILTRVMVEDGGLGPDDIGRVAEAKRSIVEREGLLEYHPVDAGLPDVADLTRLKEWLRKRRGIVAHPEGAGAAGLPFPRGILLVGIPGCGKSLAAKAVSRDWSLPLLKLDPSTLYNKYIGESEKNFRRAITTAERLAPVVLWIDELEKAFATAGGEADAGVSRRIFGSFLTWLQERKGDVFVVATANDVSRLPPEFVRKGRFDEIFFVDLPPGDVRRRIFEIHLEKREHDPSDFDLDVLAAETEGFSGADIEQTVISGLYTAFADDEPLTTGILRSEIRSTRPLSETMPERIGELRAWADGRAVMAH